MILALLALLLQTAPIPPAQKSLTNQPHSINLQWDYVQGTDFAVGFNVHRGTVSGGPYTLLNSTPLSISTLTYADTTGIGGTTYFYVVTAVDSASLESANSNESSGVFQNPPVSLTAPVIVITKLASGLDRFQADWTDAPNNTTAFVIFGGQGQVLKQGSQASSLGKYEFAIQFPPQNGSISVCNTQVCWSQVFQGQ